MKEDLRSAELIIQHEDDPLIQNGEDQSLVSGYKKRELILDIFLFAFSAWAQFGYSLYSQQNALESLNDPLSRYLYPHINANLADNIFKSADILMRVLSVSDAVFTTSSYLNMRRCRKELIAEFHHSFEKYKSVKNPPVFIANCILMWSFFIVSSFSPWTGFSRSEHNNLLCSIAGSTMWIGLMISYSMSYAPYTFSAPERIICFYKLEYNDKKDIFYSVFLTKKGLLEFLPRAAVSVVNRSWVLYGSSLLTLKWIFKTQNPFIIYSFSILSVIATAYQTLMSQVIKDYNLTFSNIQNRRNSNQNDLIDQNETATISNKIIFQIFNIMLLILSGSVFLLRTFSVPSLYTGEIHDPANNYAFKDTVLSVVGLLCGGYAAFQYVRFRRNRYQDNFAALFKAKSELKTEKIGIMDDDKTSEVAPFRV